MARLNLIARPQYIRGSGECPAPPASALPSRAHTFSCASFVRWLALVLLCISACGGPPQELPDPNLLRAQELRREARASQQSGDVAGATRLLRQAVELAPLDSQLWNDLGLAQMAGGDSNAAQASYEQSIRVAPRRYEAHLNLAVLLMKRGVSGRARTEFAQAVELQPANPLIYWNFGAGLVDAGEPEQARRYLERALEIDPSYGPALAELGRVEALAGRHDRAIARLARAESLGVDTASLHANFGLELLQAGRLEPAEAELQRATALDSTRASAWNHLGVARIRRSKLAEAAEAMHRAHGLEPGDDDVRFNLANVLMRLERYHEAVLLLQSPRPVRADLLAAWGMALRGDGRTSEALPLLREATEKAPRDVKTWNNYGVLLAESGDVPGALRAWHTVLEIDPQNDTAMENIKARSGVPSSGAARKGKHGPKSGP